MNGKYLVVRCSLMIHFLLTLLDMEHGWEMEVRVEEDGRWETKL